MTEFGFSVIHLSVKLSMLPTAKINRTIYKICCDKTISACYHAVLHIVVSIYLIYSIGGVLIGNDITTSGAQLTQGSEDKCSISFTFIIMNILFSHDSFKTILLLISTQKTTIFSLFTKQSV